MPASEWQDIPKSALEQSQRNDEASAWASEQRAALAQQWADLQLQTQPGATQPPPFPRARPTQRRR